MVPGEGNDSRTASTTIRSMVDRVFWAILSRLWPGWRNSLVIVKPETVIGWHRKGFRLFWTRNSRRRKSGRPPVSGEVRDLIRRMSQENPLWGAPRIHGEILMLGFSISHGTVSKYMVRYPKPRSQTWRTFLENHVGCLVSIDFFVVPTLPSRTHVIVLFVLSPKYLAFPSRDHPLRYVSP